MTDSKRHGYLAGYLAKEAVDPLTGLYQAYTKGGVKAKPALGKAMTPSQSAHFEADKPIAKKLGPVDLETLKGSFKPVRATGKDVLKNMAPNKVLRWYMNKLGL